MNSISPLFCLHTWNRYHNNGRCRPSRIASFLLFLTASFFISCCYLSFCILPYTKFPLLCFSSHSKRDEMADMRGKVCLVTGAHEHTRSMQMIFYLTWKMLFLFDLVSSERVLLRQSGGDLISFCFYSLTIPSCAIKIMIITIIKLNIILTGARQKIGYRCALKLLRCGASVIATTRFPVDASKRFLEEADSSDWFSR